MCGRFNLRANPRELAEYFELLREPDWSPRFNIAPTQQVLIVRQSADGARTADPVRWGLVPRWAKDLAVGSKMINARCETAPFGKGFRPAYEKRRCIVPASGFYEWEKIPDVKTKQPWHIFPATAKVFPFAGLWESWKGPDGIVETCTILTTKANEFMAPVHNRMPVILSAAGVDQWLDPNEAPKALPALCAPCPVDWLDRGKVSTLVNSPKNETPDCLNPL